MQVTLCAAVVTRRSDHTPYSFTAPDRRTLFGEGGSAFSRVRGGKHRAEHFTLPGERLAGVPVRRLDDDSLAGGQRERGAESYLCRRIPAAGQGLAGADQPTDQAGLVQPIGGEVLAGQHDLHGQVVRHPAGQPEQPACRRRQASPDLGQPELRRHARHDQVAAQGELEAAGERVPLDRGDHGLGRRPLGDPAEAAARHDGRVPAQEAPQAHARGERAARAGQDDDPRILVAVELVHRGGYAAGDLAVDSVARLGAIDRDDGDPAVAVGENRVRHPAIVASPWPPLGWPLSAERAIAARQGRPPVARVPPSRCGAPHGAAYLLAGRPGLLLAGWSPGGSLRCAGTSGRGIVGYTAESPVSPGTEAGAVLGKGETNDQATYPAGNTQTSPADAGLAGRRRPRGGTGGLRFLWQRR